MVTTSQTAHVNWYSILRFMESFLGPSSLFPQSIESNPSLPIFSLGRSVYTKS